MSNRLTTHDLAEAMLAREDAPIRYVGLGRLIVLWDDRCKHPAITTIATDEVLGPEEER